MTIKQPIASFSNWGGESSKVESYKFEGAAPHAVALFLPGNIILSVAV